MLDYMESDMSGIPKMFLTKLCRDDDELAFKVAGWITNKGLVEIPLPESVDPGEVDPGEVLDLPSVLGVYEKKGMRIRGFVTGDTARPTQLWFLIRGGPGKMADFVWFGDASPFVSEINNIHRAAVDGDTEPEDGSQDGPAAP